MRIRYSGDASVGTRGVVATATLRSIHFASMSPLNADVSRLPAGSRSQQFVQVLCAVATVLAAPRATAAAVAHNDAYSIRIVDYPALPLLDYEAGTSAWQFAYNPAFLPGQDAQGLFVRVQNGSTSPPGTCGEPASTSFVSFAPLDGGSVRRLGPQKLFSPAMTDFEQDTEDPRIIYDAQNKTWYMTYTANGIVTEGSEPPMNRHQGVATSTDPLAPGSWKRQCTSAAPCLPPGLKSGAMLRRPAPPHYMFVYDLTKTCPSNPGSVCRHTVVAESNDLLRWHLPDGDNVHTPPKVYNIYID